VNLQPALFAGGVGLLVTGAVLHLYAKGCLHQNKEVTKSGPYRYCRNPFYLANLAIDSGICLMIGRWWVALPYLLLWSKVYGETISREEAKLDKLFGDSYREYRSQVPRLLPTRRPLRGPVGAAGFSWKNPNLADGSETPRLVGFAVVPLVLWVAAEARVESVWDSPSGLFRSIAMIAVLWSIKIALVTAIKRKRRELRTRSPRAGPE